MGAEFITSFIAALIAFNFHLPADKQVKELIDLSQITNMTNEKMHSSLNQVCLGLLTETFDVGTEALDETVTPLVSRLQEQKNSSLGEAFLGEYSMDEILSSYQSLCTLKAKDNKELSRSLPISAGVQHFLNLVEDLPQSAELNKAFGKESSPVYSAKGFRIGYMDFSRGKHRITVDSKDIPRGLKLAFISAEDKTFYENTGVDLRGIFNAFVNSGSGDQLYGGSTITQQLVKNTLLSYERTLDRKINEVLLAHAVTKRYSKEQIIAHYLNYIYFGRGAWGVKAAAQSYLGKQLSELSLTDMAFLASLPKNPSNYDPAKNYDIILSRKNKVIGNLYDNGYITEKAYNRAVNEPIEFITEDNNPASLTSQYYIEAAKDELLEKLGEKVDQTQTYQVITGVEQDLQLDLTRALQNGLVRYERDLLGSYQVGDKTKFVQSNIAKRISSAVDSELEKLKEQKRLRDLQNKNDSIADEIFGNRRKKSDKNSNRESTTNWDKVRKGLVDTQWQKNLSRLSNIYADTGWVFAVHLGNNDFGLKSGEVIRLSEEANGFPWWNAFSFGDVILVEKREEKDSDSAKYFVRKPTDVQGAAVVIDNYTGSIKALSGGFSFISAPYNRATIGQRQPGSVMKPFSYLAALEAGYQPNFLIQDSVHSFRPIARGGKYWTPNSFGTPTDQWFSLRMGLEKSNNRMTAHILKLLGETPLDSLDKIRLLSEKFGMYEETRGDSLSFILGAQPTGLLNVASAYASIATGGRKVTPHLINSVRKNGKVLYDNSQSVFSYTPVGVDNLALTQLRDILKGVTSRGTAKILKEHSDYIIGKTGTTNRNQDAWFAGSTPDYTIVVWAGYDNATRAEKRYLVSTGGGVAAPIVKEFIESKSFVARNQRNKAFPKPELSYEVGYFNHEEGFVSTPEDPKAVKELYKTGSNWWANYRTLELANYDRETASKMANYYAEIDGPGLVYHTGSAPSSYAHSPMYSSNREVVSPDSKPNRSSGTDTIGTTFSTKINPDNVYVTGTTEYEAYLMFLNSGGNPSNFTYRLLVEYVNLINQNAEEKQNEDQYYEIF